MRCSLSAVGEIFENALAFVLTIAIQTALHALESYRVLVAAVGFGEAGHVVDALQEVGDLAFSSFRVASTAIWSRTGLIELLHLSFAQSSILEAVDKGLQSIHIVIPVVNIILICHV